jgi:hypothetical protein
LLNILIKTPVKKLLIQTNKEAIIDKETIPVIILLIRVLFILELSIISKPLENFSLRGSKIFLKAKKINK